MTLNNIFSLNSGKSILKVKLTKNKTPPEMFAGIGYHKLLPAILKIIAVPDQTITVNVKSLEMQIFFFSARSSTRSNMRLRTFDAVKLKTIWE